MSGVDLLWRRLCGCCSDYECFVEEDGVGAWWILSLRRQNLKCDAVSTI